jgi:hypothetical protein
MSSQAFTDPDEFHLILSQSKDVTITGAGLSAASGEVRTSIPVQSLT